MTTQTINNQQLTQKEQDIYQNTKKVLAIALVMSILGSLADTLTNI